MKLIILKTRKQYFHGHPGHYREVEVDPAMIPRVGEDLLIYNPNNAQADEYWRVISVMWRTSIRIEETIEPVVTITIAPYGGVWNFFMRKLNRYPNREGRQKLEW